MNDYLQTLQTLDMRYWGSVPVSIKDVRDINLRHQSDGGKVNSSLS
jgi:hypothetical protein